MQKNIPSNILTGPDKFELFADCDTETGEGPLWNHKEQALYWIDVSRGHIFRKLFSCSSTKKFDRFEPDVGNIGGLAFTTKGSCLLFASKGRVWEWRPGIKPVLRAELPEAAGTRFNDVIADPAGRVFCGVAPSVKNGPSSLWLMDNSCRFTCVEPALLGMPNGMGFSPCRRKLYFTLTGARTIYRYDYDQATGSTNNRIVFVKVPDNEGAPDGMTVDAEGCVWSGQWDGSRLVRYSPDGEKILEFMFPIKKISCVAFGGPELDVIFISTANKPFDNAEYARSKAGSVFSMKQSIRGALEFYARIS
jgi:D-xylonolactonase